MFQRSVLPGGLRVITVQLATARSFSAVAYVRAGSRMESRAESGMAHFMEHLTFKGTATWPTTRAVSEAIEGIGGTSNAATDREATTYWARVPSRSAGLAMQMLGELVAQPLLREEDVAHERTVIVEEIRSYRDDPGEYVFNLLDLAMFGDTPLGWEIAGDEETVAAMTAPALRGFWERWYQPSNVVLAAAGELGHEAVCEMAARAFGSDRASAPAAGSRFEPAPATPAADRVRLVNRPGSQAHLCVAVPALRRDDPDQWALELLDTVLGEGMSSRLFLHLREEEGLAYDVHSFITDYADAGMFGVYAGVDPHHLSRALDGVLAELREVREHRLPDDELARAKAYACGRLELRLEEGRNLASWLGAQEALHERTLTLDEAEAEIQAVDAEQIRSLAERLFTDDALSLAAIAPGRRGRGLERRLRLS
ncbi:MAG: pitrilysin family protein [Chloroflexi bacterium]|nr:pitrilysin family protein [Chloroflexota bacterium]